MIFHYFLGLNSQMTSAHKMLRQRDQATSILPQLYTPGTYWYLVPTTGNYVGNYSPGYMMIVPNSQIPPEGTLMRDMGKTISAIPLNVNYKATPGLFRAIQFITPDPSVSATGKTTFGVYGNVPRSLRPGNIGDRGYRTYYTPIVVNGTLGTFDGVVGLPPGLPYPLFGGQM